MPLAWIPAFAGMTGWGLIPPDQGFLRSTLGLASKTYYLQCAHRFAAACETGGMALCFKGFPVWTFIAGSLAIKVQNSTSRELVNIESAPPRRRIALLLNPVAGRGRALAYGTALNRALLAAGAQTRVWEPSAADAIGRIACEAARDRFDLMAAVGGDGTLAAAAGAVLDAGLSLAVAPAPAGTANVVARALGYPLGNGRTALDRLAAILARAPFRRFDVVRLESAEAPPRRFLMSAGFGPDAEIVAAAHSARRGPMTFGNYIRPIAKALFRRERPRARAWVDGVEAATGATVGMAANFSLYAGWLRPCPAADPSDGRLELLAGAIDGWPGWLGWAWRLWRGTAAGLALARTARGVRMEWRQETPGDRIPMQADGDPAGFLPARLEVEPGVLPMPAVSNFGS